MYVFGKVLALVLLVAVTGVAGCHRDRCVPICEQRAKEHGCHPMDPCKLTCEKLHTATACRKELKAFESCFLARPSADWECDIGDQTPIVHADLCAQERRDVTACLMSQPTGQTP